MSVIKPAFCLAGLCMDSWGAGPVPASLGQRAAADAGTLGNIWGCSGQCALSGRQLLFI